MARARPVIRNPLFLVCLAVLILIGLLVIFPASSLSSPPSPELSFPSDVLVDGEECIDGPAITLSPEQAPPQCL